MAKTSFSNRAAAVPQPEPEKENAPTAPVKRALASVVKPVIKATAHSAPLTNKKVEVAIEDEVDGAVEKIVSKKRAAKAIEEPTELKQIEEGVTLSTPEQMVTLDYPDEQSVAIPVQQVEGQLDRSDFEIPSLKLVQSIGPMSENFEAGIFVLNGEVPLCDPEGPVQLAVLRIKKDFEENLQWGSEERPRTFNSIEEVRQAGLHVEWIDNEKPPVSPRATVLAAVKRPTGLEEDPSFPFEDVEGDSWALALWVLKGTGYTSAAKKFFTASEFSLKGKLHYGLWNVHTKRENRGGNLVWVPKPVRAAELLDSRVAEFLKSLSM